MIRADKSPGRRRFGAHPFPFAVKPTSLLLAASLVANVAIVGLYLARPPARPAETLPTTAAPRPAGGQPDAAVSEALRAALERGDAAALTAAGLSPELAREIALGRTFSRLAERIRTQPAGGDARWWRTRATNATREQQLVARREFADALTAAFGDDLGLFTAGGDATLSFLSPEKRLALRRITQDYDEMMAKFGAGGVQLPSDRERLKLLRAERDRDIAALLTPAEREAYELRTSATAANVRARYGDGIETEDDFRKVYALQKAFDEKYPLDAATGRVSPETLRQRADAARQLQDDLRGALGDQKYTALRRASDSDLRNVESLATRLNLAADTTDRVAAAREALAAESQRLNADPALSPQQRRTAIQDLATKAKADLNRTLGAEAGEAYAQRSPWVSMLQGGLAYSTTPQAGNPTSALATGQSVFPVMPAGGAPGATRQAVFVGGTPSVELAGGGEPGVPREVITFSTSVVESTGSSGGQRVIVAPGTVTIPPSGQTGATPGPKP